MEVDEPSVHEVAEVLELSHGIRPDRLERIQVGNGAINYKCVVGGCDFFVKFYPRYIDLPQQRFAIEVQEVVRRAGLPTPKIRRSLRGSLIGVARERAVAVWEYVEGEVSFSGLTVAKSQQLGNVLGQLHLVLAGNRDLLGLAKDGGAGAAACATSLNPLSAMNAIDNLLGLLDRCQKTNFALWSARALSECRGLLSYVTKLWSEIPLLEAQLLHGDLSLPNVLFRGDSPVALVDFTPISHLPAWEVGRIGCDPQTILNGTTWIESLAALAAAYCDHNSRSAVANLEWCVRVWLCSVVTNTSGIQRVLEGRVTLPERFESHLIARHEAMLIALDNLGEVEGALRDVCRSIIH